MQNKLAGGMNPSTHPKVADGDNHEKSKRGTSRAPNHAELTQHLAEAKGEK